MFDGHKCRISITVLLALGISISTTEAQDVPRSLEQLRQVVREGDKVLVTDVHGHEIEGRVAEVAASSLGLVVAGTRINLAETDLDTVSRRDSRWNGTLWGLALGAALGAAFEWSLVDEYGRDDIGYGEGVLPLAGLGAAIGFVVDTAIKGRRIIYARGDSSTKNLNVSPVLNTNRKGILVSLRF